MTETLAERARSARIRAGFRTEADAAKAIGCSRPLVIAWEKGDVKSIGGKYLTAAARAYRVRPEYLAMQSDTDGFPWSDCARPVSGDTALAALQAEVQELRLLATTALVVMASHRPVEAKALLDALQQTPGDTGTLSHLQDLLAEALGSPAAAPRSGAAT